MQYEEYSWFSYRVNREMRIRVYGHYGEAVVAFPCQGQYSDDFANNGMIDALAPLIESGRMKLYCLDSIDDETISSCHWDKGLAARKLCAYHDYFIEEAMPFIREKQGGYAEPLLIGCSSGAAHAADAFFHRPDLFHGFLALSCTFDLARCFDGYFDEAVNYVSPVHFLSSLHEGDGRLDAMKGKAMVAVIGEGPYEDQVRYTYDWMRGVSEGKGVGIEFHYWDGNVGHDWDSWRYEMPYFLHLLLP